MTFRTREAYVSPCRQHPGSYHPDDNSPSALFRGLVKRGLEQTSLIRDAISIQSGLPGGSCLSKLVIQTASLSVAKLVSHTIIVKIGYDEKGELNAHNFDRRYDQRLAMTAEIKQILGGQTTIFAVARLTNNGMIILQRARDRAW